MGVSTRPTLRRTYSKLEVQLDELLNRREKHAARIKTANEKLAIRQAKAQKRWEKEVGKAPEKLAKTDRKLAAFLERNHYQLTRRLTKTIKRLMGEVYVKIDSPEFDWAGDDKPAINFLLNRTGGKQYLTQTWSLNKRALKGAPEALKLELRKRFGIWFGKHRLISVKSPSSEKTVALSRRRYNERKY